MMSKTQAPKLKAIVTTLLVAGPAYALCQTWDIAQNFTTEQNPNDAWAYGYYQLYPALDLPIPASRQTFIPIIIPNDGLSYSGYVSQYLSPATIIRFGSDEFLTVRAGFASYIGYLAPVVRWTAPSSGAYNLTSSISYINQSGGLTNTSQVGLRLNDQILLQQDLRQVGEKAIFKNSIFLQKGDYLDIFAAKGQNLIGYSLSISGVPEASNAAMTLASLVTFSIFAIGRKNGRQTANSAR
jgi:hypothetical protein